LPTFETIGLHGDRHLDDGVPRREAEPLRECAPPATLRHVALDQLADQLALQRGVGAGVHGDQAEDIGRRGQESSRRGEHEVGGALLEQRAEDPGDVLAHGDLGARFVSIACTWTAGSGRPSD
jgi:hypothetical protein